MFDPPLTYALHHRHVGRPTGLPETARDSSVTQKDEGRLDEPVKLFYTGAATLTNVTISGNTSAGNGGGIFNGVTGSTTTVTSTTIVENTADDGGGIGSFTGTVTVGNTIVANNSSPNCNTIAAVDSMGHNLESDDTCDFDQSSDLINTDPFLGPLQDNDGLTRTHALLPGSPAIDAGTNDGCPSTDQRSVPRPVDGNLDDRAICDIGAYEYTPVVHAIYLPFIANNIR